MSQWTSMLHRALLMASLLLAAHAASAAAPKLAWQVDIPSYADKPTFADLDGDGRFEVILACGDGSVVALDGASGAEIWRHNVDNESFTNSPAVVDVDRDGGTEVIVAGNRNGTLVCLSGATGEPRWQKRTRGETVGGSPVIINRELPAGPLLVVVMGTRLRVLEALNGDVVWETALPQDSLGTVGVGRPDGGERLVIGTRRGRLLAYDIDGNALWETTLAGPINAAPLVVDLDFDGVDEIYAIGSSLYCLDTAGKEIWRWAPPKGAGIASSLAVADINHDQKQEIVLTSYDGSVYAISPAGRTVWSSPVVTAGGGDATIPASTPVLIDTKGTFEGTDVLLVSPMPSAPGLLGFDGKTGKRLWRVPLARFSQCCPAVAEVTGDRYPEIIVTDASNTAYCFTLGNEVRRGWVRFGSSLWGSSTETERRRQTEQLLAGKMPFPTLARAVGENAIAEAPLGPGAPPPAPPAPGTTAGPVQVTPPTPGTETGGLPQLGPALEPATPTDPTAPGVYDPSPPVRPPVPGEPGDVGPIQLEPTDPVTEPTQPTEPVDPTDPIIVITVPGAGEEPGPAPGDVGPVQTEPLPPVTDPEPEPVQPPTRDPQPVEPPVVEPVPYTPPTSATRPRSAVAVSLDGAWLDLDPQPRLVNQRVMVPLRGVFQALGAVVDYDNSTKVINAVRGSSTVNLKIGARQATVNGETVALDVPAQLINGTTYVPLRFVSQALGASVNWVAASKDVEIRSVEPTHIY